MTDPEFREQDPMPEGPSLHEAAHAKTNIWAKRRAILYVVAASIALFVFIIFAKDQLLEASRWFLEIFAPVIIGCVIAYLCDPILEFFEYRVFRRMKKGNLRRGLSLALTTVTVVALIALFFFMMVPQLIQSIRDLIDNYQVYIEQFLNWLQSIINMLNERFSLGITLDISDLDKLRELLLQIFSSENSQLPDTGKWSDLLANIDKSSILDVLKQLIQPLMNLSLGVYNTVKNVVLGIFIAFYILASKEKRAAQFAKFRKAVFKEKTSARIQEIITLTDRTFGGFIYGKILDSLVIGVLTFVLLAIFNISPYNLLIATFVGVTNIIPVFGPIIGAIPTFFIVLISNPGKAFLFLILILLIQQLDGNVIGPKILGDSTGVSSLCVIIAISVCGAMWGVAGMIIGVPLFAVVIELIKRYLEMRLRQQGEPTDTTHYYPKDAVGNAELDVHYEHAHLLYAYRHSKFKDHVDRFLGRGKSKTEKAEKQSKKNKKNKKNKNRSDSEHTDDR